MSETTHMGNWS